MFIYLFISQVNMGDLIPAMASFGTENGLPSFSLCEVDRSDTLEAIVEKFSPTGWNDSNESSIGVKVSSTRSATNYDKFNQEIPLVWF